MRLRVRLFASLRERAGRERLELEGVPDGTDVAGAKRLLEARHPELGPLQAVRGVLGTSYVPDETPLAEGEELALLPPVSGGSGRALAEERWAPADAQRVMATAPLAGILLAAMADADAAPVADGAFLELMGLDVVAGGGVTAGDVWRHLMARVESEIAPEHRRALNVILERGPLARRLRRALPGASARDDLRRVYNQLCDCLENGEMLT